MSQELNDLRNAYRNGDLNLYLGAGVSAESGLPNWRQLVVSMYFRYMSIEQWESIKPYPNYLYAVGDWYLKETGESLDIIIRKLKANLSEGEFLHILYNCLYNQLDGAQVRNPFTANPVQNKLLVQLTELIAKPNRKLNSIITYNFDDLLEQSLASRNVNFVSVYNSTTLPHNGSIPIYHPHGFMPFNRSAAQNQSWQDIILSEDDYNSIANTSHHWANMIQTSKLTQGTGLMIGLSFSDRNLRRLVDLISNIPLNTNNYIFLKKNRMPEFTDKDSLEIKKNADAISEKMIRAGIKTERKAYDNCNRILTEMFRMDEIITQRVFDQMRIKPIWVNDYPDIAEYIKKIRE